MSSLLSCKANFSIFFLQNKIAWYIYFSGSQNSMVLKKNMLGKEKVAGKKVGEQKF